MDNSRSRGKKQRKDISSLPEAVIFAILIRLPADFLYYFARYVCKGWAKIISDPSFKTEQLNCSKSGIFFQTPYSPHYAIYCNVRERHFEVELVHAPLPGQLLSTAKGISLFHADLPTKKLYVGNLVTRKFKNLPYPIMNKERLLGCHIITHVPQSRQFKVLCSVRSSKVCKWRVFTLGIDQFWRDLESHSSQINLLNKEQKVTVASVGGVVYLSRGKGEISSLDLNLETSYSLQTPDEFMGKRYWLCEMGNSLSCGVNIKGDVHVYMLNDLKEWVKMYNLIKVVDKNRFLVSSLVPVGWLGTGDIFVFNVRLHGYWKDRYIVSYNVKSGKKLILKDDNPGKIHIFSKSLLSW